MNKFGVLWSSRCWRWGHSKRFERGHFINVIHPLKSKQEVQ